MEPGYLALDIGGTFIKGTFLGRREFLRFLEERDTFPLADLLYKTEKVAAPFSDVAEEASHLAAIQELVKKLNPGSPSLTGIGISTTGIVDYHGAKILKTNPGLSVLCKTGWREQLETIYSCPVVLVNDCDAAMIGMAELGYLNGPSTTGIMVIGTGLGFSICRNGRRWRPGGNLPLLGSIRTPMGTYDQLVSASGFASLGQGGSLADALLNPALEKERKEYFRNMYNAAATAADLYNLDKVFISGGLVDAAAAAGADLAQLLEPFCSGACAGSFGPFSVKFIREGNMLQLLGAVSLIAGEADARMCKSVPGYREMDTELPYDRQAMLHRYAAEQVTGLLLDAEKEAGLALDASRETIARVAMKIASSLADGGRLIYVGAGTSGRLAAIDALEIPCTFGLPKDQVIALVAGGIADAAMEIESNFEEDASAVSEMLLLDIKSMDVVVGISASGSAYYVQSALAFAKSRGAFSVLIRAGEARQDLSFCDLVIPLHSGREVVAGSTRLKAGTATKKVLNCLTTTAMILNGKVVGPYMTNMACINEKLVGRAQAILREIYQLSPEDSRRVLSAHDWNLQKSCQFLNQQI